MPYDSDTSIGGRAAAFPLTRWSVIRSAAEGGTAGCDALGAVMELYWKPVYKYIRVHWRRSNEDAKDLVQAFFTAMMEQDLLARFDPEKGTFRGWLRACADRFVKKQDEFASRWKRGGGLLVDMDFAAAEREIGLTDAAQSPEDIFFREWRREAFALALRDLEAHCRASGRTLQYEVFAAYDLAEGESPRYADVAARFGLAVTTVTNHLAAARRELRRLVLRRLASVTSGSPELHAEARALFREP